MLVETKTDGEAPDICDINTLIPWLDKQPGDTFYFWASPSGCLMAQYAKAHGSTYGHLCLRQRNRGLDVEFGDVAIGLPHTFGGALARCRKEANRLSA